MIKIGIECESIEDNSWGVGRLVYKLLEELSKREELKHEFRFFLYFKSRIPDLPFLKSPMFVKKITKPLWFPASFNLHYHVWMIARAYLDGINVLFFPNYMLPLLWFKKSLVMLADDIYYEMHNTQLPFRYRLAYSIFSNWAAKRATRIVAISESSKKELMRLFKIKPERIIVNYLAVDEQEHIAPDTNHGDYLLFVGQMFPRRHAKETLLAFEHIAPDFPELKLVMIGMDKYRPPVIRHLANAINGQLSRLINRGSSTKSGQSQRVIYKEYVPQEELDNLYAGTKALVYVSDHEAFGLPPMEALVYGVPAIVADAPISHELFGEYAFFTKSSVAAITGAIKDALTNESKRLRITYQKDQILRKFTWANHTEIFLKTLDSLVCN